MCIMSDKTLKITTKKYQGDSSVVSVRLPNELIESLDRISKITGRTRNDIMQRCLEFAIENLEIEEK